MSKQVKQVRSKAEFPSRSGAGRARHKQSDVGQVAESLQLFAGIHKSTRFTIEAAHHAFAGLKRTK